jgi:hypothetical protein
MARPLGDRVRADPPVLAEWIRPQLTALVDEAPEGSAWLHEIKFDGFRMHARLERHTTRPTVQELVAPERQRSLPYGRRSVFGWEHGQASAKIGHIDRR